MSRFDMKRSAIVIITTFSTLSFVFPVLTSANVSVNVSGNGEGASSNVRVHQEGTVTKTECHNGNCETSSTGGISTVCEGDNCQTFNGDVHYESNNGNTKITVENGLSGTLSPQPTDFDNENDENELQERKHVFITRTPEPTSSSAQKKFHKTFAHKEVSQKHLIKDTNGKISALFASFEKLLQEFFHKN